MKYKLFTTSTFNREFKRLAKKFPSLKSDIELFRKKLLHDVHAGVSLGGGVYKWRLQVASKAKGKSGGMRVITFLEVDLVVEDSTNIFFISIYGKSEVSSISSQEIKRRIQSKNK